MADEKIYRRSLAEMEAEREWSKAEEQFIKQCRDKVILGQTRPKDGKADLRIRAELIRHAMLGGCDDMPVAAVGPFVMGAWIAGPLDMQGVRSRFSLRLHHCHFDSAPDFDDAVLAGLYLTGSFVPGVLAQRLSCSGTVHLNDGFESKGPVSLIRARIGGQLACTGGEFDGGDGVALNCDALEVGTDVFLRGGFRAKGAVNFVRAQIKGHVQCNVMGRRLPGCLTLRGAAWAVGFSGRACPRRRMW